jgi:hypothetical protein
MAPLSTWLPEFWQKYWNIEQTLDRDQVEGV